MKTTIGMIRATVVLLLLCTLLLGGAYPFLVLGAGKLLFPHRAAGSLVEKNGAIVGSELLGQEFTAAKYFRGRLSATTPPYNAAASSGSNLSPGNPKLKEAVEARIAALQKLDPKNKAPVPVDLVTASGSGLDPHISPAAAEYQLARVARARGMKEAQVRALVKQYTEGDVFGMVGRSYVNVVLLNLALDNPENQTSR